MEFRVRADCQPNSPNPLEMKGFYKVPENDFEFLLPRILIES